MTDPARIVVAGDWHGDATWACGVIGMLPGLLPDESPRRIVHLGDFGVWPGLTGDRYLREVGDALSGVDGELWFIDGNHECFPRLHAIAPDGAGRRMIGDRIRWLPRGHRWTWHGRTWLALGGATSVDRPARIEGRSWWPQEALNLADCELAARATADVMVCHDAPSSVPLNLPRPAPGWWELEPAERHRELLQAVVNDVRPRWLMHGHYHLAHDTTVAMAHGDVHVTGLDRDGAPSGNYRVLDVRAMTWEHAVLARSASEKPTRPTVTSVQRKILNAITDSVTERGYPPSVRELADAAGLASTSSVAHQLRQLELKGRIRRDPTRSRAIQVITEPGRDDAPIEAQG